MSSNLFKQDLTSLLIEDIGHLSDSENLSVSLDLALQLTQERLQNFASDPDFDTKMRLVFGDEIDVTALRQAWAVEDFSIIPNIEIRAAAEINGANGAYAAATNIIYLAQELLEQNAGNPDAVAEVLLEEVGHAIDAQINANDTPGDEGAAFTALVRGELLDKKQIIDFRNKQDFATIILDGQILEIEQAQSVSDSGGFEGSQQTITLESTEGGVATFRYEHFTIPDNFIIRYEGRNLLETGFTGGSRTGEVQIPEGDSNTLEIIVATNDEGTAWNYDVNVDVCPDSEPFNIEAANDEFEDADSDGDCEASGTVFVGRDDGTARLIRVEGTDAEYDENNLTTSNATVFAEIGGVSEPLFTSNLEIPFGSGTSQVSDSGDAANDFTLAGLEVQFEELTINRNDLGLKGRFSLPEEIGGIEIDSSALGLDSIVVINQNGVRLGAAGTIPLPDTPEFSFFNLFEVEAEELSISYDDTINQLKLQGRVEFESFLKDTFIDEVKADFTGENFIQIQDGEADFAGSLIIETELESRTGWGLSEVQIDINTIDNTVGGSAAITFPFKGRVPEGSIGLEFATSPFALNRAAIGADQLNVPVPSFPGVFFQRINGEVDNLAPSASDPITFTGGVGFSAGPNIAGNELLSFDLTVSLNQEELTGTGTVVLLDPLILEGQGTGTLNWNKKFVEQTGSLNILDGLIQTNSGFKANSNFDVDIAGSASVGIPNSIPLFGGQQVSSGNFLLDYNNNNTLSDDFAAGWGTLEVGAFGFSASIVLGFKGFFDGRFERIGSKNIPSTNSFIVEPGTEWIILGADWENEIAGNVPVNIEKPDGTIISEADFNATNRIAVVDELTDSTTKVVIVFNPEPGVWDIEVADSTGLGEVEYNAARDSVAPTINIIEPAVDVSGGNVSIEYEAFDADSDAEIQLFYDDNNEGFDGLLIADELIETDGSGSFVWDTQGVPTGEYFIYGMVMDENNAPAFSYSEGKVIISEEADLSVTQTITPESILTGENFTYTVTITNNGSSDSTGVLLTQAIPEDVTILSSSVVPSEQIDNKLTFDIGDLNNGESTSIDIEVTAPLNSGIIESNAFVTSDIFDPDATNDSDFLTLFIDEPTLELPDLEVVRTDNSGTASLGEDYTYTLTVTNNGQGEATGVILTETLPSVLDVISATADINVENNTNLVDLIEIQLDSGDNVKIDIDAREFGSSLDSVLRLFDAAGNQVAVSDDNPAPGEFFTRDSYIDFTASVSDTYYVGVSGFSNFNYNPLIDGSGDQFSSSGSYDLEIIVGNDSSITQGVLSEPNNTIPTATDSGLSSANPGTFITSGFIRSDSNNNPVNISGNTVTANLGNLESGESATVNLTVNSFGAGNLVTTTDVVSNENDLNLIDNSLITTINISPVIPSSADLELSKTVDNPNPETGDEISFTLTITNQGPGIASGIEIDSLLPNGLTFISAIAEQGSYDSNTGIWDVGNVRDNLSRTLQINARVDGSGLITTTSEVIAVNEADPDSVPNNNNSGEDDQVSITLDVPSDNNPPVAEDDAFSTAENTAIIIPAIDLLTNDTDPDGDTLTIESVANAINGTVELDDTNITFTPDADFEGDASFIYTISDGLGGEDSATVSITVTPDTSEPNVIEGSTGRDNLSGTDEDDLITGGQGRDVISTGDGQDILFYSSIVDAGDIITDFEVGADIFDFSQLLESFSYEGSDPFADGYIQVVGRGSSSIINVDVDGIEGSGRARQFVLVENITAEDLSNPDNFDF